MPVSAATLQKMMEYGLEGQRLLEVVSLIDADMAAQQRPERTARQETNARYYAKKKSERLNSDLNSDTENDLNSDNSKKEIPPIPPKEKNYTHSTGEPSDGQRYADAVRRVYDLARQACPDLSALVRWRKAGWPVEIVCEVIRAKLAANPTKNFTLTYFENAVADAVARANAPVPIGSANQRAGPSAPREKPISAAAAILQKARQKASHERYNPESQPVVIDATPLAIGPR